MYVIIYSDDPKVNPVKLKVNEKKWDYPEFIKVDEEDLPFWIYEKGNSKYRWVRSSEVKD